MLSLLLIYVLLTILNTHILTAIQITSLTIPTAVRNNSGQPATLDCDYNLRPGEKGLVLRWYLGETRVYHWQPPNRPIVTGPLKGKVDLEYSFSDDPLKVHRGLRIVNPTTAVEGLYKCYVLTKSGKDEEEKRMIVFETEEKLAMSVELPTKGYINFSCSVYGVYPEPKLSLFKSDDFTFDLFSRETLDVVEWTSCRHHTGRYDMSVVATSPVANMTPGDVVECELNISGAGYFLKKSLVYYPPYYVRSGTSVLSMLHIILVVAVWLVLFI